MVVLVLDRHVTRRPVRLDPPTDYYSVLSIPSTASQADIKAAYHHALLRFHPDKSNNSQSVSITSIKEAYNVLSSAKSRAAYDAQLTKNSALPRPAQVVSLEEFDDSTEDEWCHPCRCGGSYKITSEEMEKCIHLVGCGSCSEVIWAGYEIIEDEIG
jgi:diphthamide biosynthesis protein 4